jgi:hypothetical protein
MPGYVRSQSLQVERDGHGRDQGLELGDRTIFRPSWCSFRIGIAGSRELRPVANHLSESCCWSRVNVEVPKARALRSKKYWTSTK